MRCIVHFAATQITFTHICVDQILFDTNDIPLCLAYFMRCHLRCVLLGENINKYTSDTNQLMVKLA